MKMLSSLLCLLLAGCASGPSAEERAYTEYVRVNRPLVESGALPWSQYYRGLYERALIANAPGNVFSDLNRLVEAADKFEIGTITKPEFDSVRREVIESASAHNEARAAAERERLQALSQQQLAFAATLLQNSGPRYLAAQPSADYQWSWDQFYNEYRQLVWVCRGVQTAQFAETWRCNGQIQSDWRWPQK